MSGLLASLSAIIPRTCSNLACRSSATTNAPLQPHRNFMWNSVLENENLRHLTSKSWEIGAHLKASSRSASNRLWSFITSLAFRWYCGKLLQQLRMASKWANMIEAPKSWVFVSNGVMHVLTSDDCGLVGSEIGDEGVSDCHRNWIIWLSVPYLRHLQSTYLWSRGMEAGVGWLCLVLAGSCSRSCFSKSAEAWLRNWKRCRCTFAAVCARWFRAFGSENIPN